MPTWEYIFFVSKTVGVDAEMWVRPQSLVMEVRRSTEMRYDILVAVEGRAGGPRGYVHVLRAPRITPSRFVPSPVRRVIVGFRAFWPRSIVFRLVEREGKIEERKGLGRLPGCGPCRPCGTSLRPTLGRAWNEFNSTALRNWLRSHSSGKFLIVCPAAVGGVRAFPSWGWSLLSSGGLTTSIYAWDTAGVSRVFRVVSRTRVPLAC